MNAQLAIFVCVFATSLFSLPNIANTDGDTVKITPIQLPDKIYMLTGKGGNMGLMRVFKFLFKG